MLFDFLFFHHFLATEHRGHIHLVQALLLSFPLVGPDLALATFRFSGTFGGRSYFAGEFRLIGRRADGSQHPQSHAWAAANNGSSCGKVFAMVRIKDCTSGTTLPRDGHRSRHSVAPRVRGGILPRRTLNELGWHSLSSVRF